MLNKFYPCDYVEDVFSIDYEKLYRDGYRGVLFDIDNTLVPHGDDSTADIDTLFEAIHETGLKTIIVSNNDQERIERFLENIDSPYVCDAEKPRKHGYLDAVKALGIRPEEAICIGDQVFTDVLGANRCGIDCILVKYIGYYDEGYKGKRRALESAVLKRYESRAARGSAGGNDVDESSDAGSDSFGTGKALYHFLVKRDMRFCDINPTFYAISEQKEIQRRRALDLMGHDKFAKELRTEKLPNVVYEYSSNLIKRGPGIDLQLQLNKATNIELAAATMNGMVIHPGETFSFWHTVGNTTERKGYKDGRIITGDKLEPGIGGGLCNLSNTIHLLVLHSPLEVTEFHSHSDALAPDGPKRIPLSTGTSVSYNYIDFRFKNTTDQDFQLFIWCADDKLYGELRSEQPISRTYELIEEGHRFQKEDDGKFYRVSKIYREVRDAPTGYLVEKKLILDNHSEVMFDYSLIPEDQIRPAE